MGEKKKGTSRLLPFGVVEKAASGDVEAINRVLRHYEGYILLLATRRYFDEDGKEHFFVDEELRRTLVTKLIVKLMQFDVARVA